MNKLELLEKRNNLIEQMKFIINNCKSQKRELLKVEDDEFRSIQNQINQLDKQIINNNTKPKQITKMSLFRNLIHTTKGEAVEGQAELKAELRKAGLNIADNSYILRAYSPVGGDTTIATEVAPVREQLEETSLVAKLGGNVVRIPSTFVIPSVNSCTLYWDYEDGQDTADAGAKLSAAKLEVKRLSGFIPVDKKLIALNSDGSLETALLNTIYKVADNKISEALFTKLTGVTTTSATTVYGKILDLEADMLTKKVNASDLVYVCNPKTMAKLKLEPKNNGKIFEAVVKDGMIDNTKVIVTASAEDNKVYMIDGSKVWNNIAALEILVDEVSLSHKGQNRLVVNIYTDIAIENDVYCSTVSLV